MSATNEERYQRALISLDGLSVGDAFGEKFFISPGILEHRIATRTLPEAPWRFTDDTNMALSIVSILREYGEIDQEMLAHSFAYRFHRARGYGPGMIHLLNQVRLGFPWDRAAPALFNGQGSFGNGSAMRVAPLGAYFADDLDAVVENARLSSLVTHTHPEAVAGAIAVAVGTALAWQSRAADAVPSRQDFLERVIAHVPTSHVKAGIQHAIDLPANASVPRAVSTLGNGSQISAQDTVAFVLWCAGGSLGDYEEALWLTVSGLGDRDTTCAMVGGIVAAYTGRDGIPDQWLLARESLPSWPFVED